MSKDDELERRARWAVFVLDKWAQVNGVAAPAPCFHEFTSKVDGTALPTWRIFDGLQAVGGHRSRFATADEARIACAELLVARIPDLEKGYRARATEDAEAQSRADELRCDCKHGKPLCEMCLDEAPKELLRLNPYARHDVENKPPEDPVGKFVFGVRYYAGMLEDGDSWWHSLGHIESCCVDFQDAINARAGKPSVAEAQAYRAKVVAKLIATVRESLHPEDRPSDGEMRLSAEALDKLAALLVTEK